MKHLKKFESSNIMNKELLNKEYYNFIEEISIDFIEKYNCKIGKDDTPK